VNKVSGINVPHIDLMKAVLQELHENGIDIRVFGLSATDMQDAGGGVLGFHGQNQDYFAQPQFKAIRELTFAVSRAFKGVAHGHPEPAPVDGGARPVDRRPVQLAAAALDRERPFSHRRIVKGTLDKERWAFYRNAVFTRDLVQNANNFTAASLAVGRKIMADRAAGFAEGYLKQTLVDFISTYGPAPGQEGLLIFSEEQREELQSLSANIDILDRGLRDGSIVNIARGAEAPVGRISVTLPVGFYDKIQNLRRVLAQRPVANERADEAAPARLEGRTEQLVRRFQRQSRARLLRQHSTAARHLMSWIRAINSSADSQQEARRQFGDLQELERLIQGYFALTQEKPSPDMKRLARMRVQIEAILPMDIFNDDSLFQLSNIIVEDFNFSPYIGGRGDSRQETFFQRLERKVLDNLDCFTQHPQVLKAVIKWRTLIDKRNRLIQEWEELETARVAAGPGPVTPLQKRLEAHITSINTLLDQEATRIRIPHLPPVPVLGVLLGDQYSARESFEAFKAMKRGVETLLKDKTLSPKERRYIQKKAIINTRIFLQGLKRKLAAEGHPVGDIAALERQISKEVRGMIALYCNGQTKGSPAFLDELLALFVEVNINMDEFPENNHLLISGLFKHIKSQLEGQYTRSLNDYLHTFMKVLRGRHTPRELKLDVIEHNIDPLNIHWHNIHPEQQRRLNQLIDAVREPE